MEMSNPYIFSNLRVNLGYSERDVRSCFSLATLGFVKAAMFSKDCHSLNLKSMLPD